MKFVSEYDLGNVAGRVYYDVDDAKVNSGESWIETISCCGSSSDYDLDVLGLGTEAYKICVTDTSRMDVIETFIPFKTTVIG